LRIEIKQKEKKIHCDTLGARPQEKEEGQNMTSIKMTEVWGEVK